MAVTINVTSGIGNAGAFPFSGAWWEQSGAGYANTAASPPFPSASAGSASSTSVNGSTLQSVGAAANGVLFSPSVSGPVFILCFPAGLPQNFITTVKVTKAGGSQSTFNTASATQFNPTATGGGNISTLTTWVWSIASVAALFANGIITSVEFDFSPPVPNVVGDDLFDATAAIVAAGFVLGTVMQVNDPATPAGLVLSQSPAAGTLSTPGTAVNLVLSLGPTNPQTIRAIKVVAQKANGIEIQFVYSPLGIL